MKRSDNAAYLRARLARDHPEIAQRLTAGGSLRRHQAAEHYNLAKQEHAAEDFIKVVQEERRRTRDLAKRFFRSTE